MVLKCVNCRLVIFCFAGAGNEAMGMNGMKNLYSFKEEATKSRDVLDILSREEREGAIQGRNPFQMQTGKANAWGND